MSEILTTVDIGKLKSHVARSSPKQSGNIVCNLLDRLNAVIEITDENIPGFFEGYDSHRFYFFFDEKVRKKIVEAYFKNYSKFSDAYITNKMMDEFIEFADPSSFAKVAKEFYEENSPRETQVRKIFKVLRDYPDALQGIYSSIKSAKMRKSLLKLMPSAAVGLADANEAVRAEAKVKLGLEKKKKSINHRNRVKKIFREVLEEEFGSNLTFAKGHFCTIDFAKSPNKNIPKLNRVTITFRSEERYGKKSPDYLYFTVTSFKEHDYYNPSSRWSSSRYYKWKRVKHLDGNFLLHFIDYSEKRYGEQEFKIKKADYKKFKEYLPKLINWIKTHKE